MISRGIWIALENPISESMEPTTTAVSTIGAMYFVAAARIGMAVIWDEITATRVTGILFADPAVIFVTR